LLDIHDRMDRKDKADRIEPTLAAEAIEPTDRIEPADPTERIEPTEPTDRIEPLDPMLSSESCDPIDHREPLLSLMPGILAPRPIHGKAGSGAPDAHPALVNYSGFIHAAARFSWSESPPFTQAHGDSALLVTIRTSPGE
jgi:hypothetical protein